jgi:pimeloyl-ACP methyl ester carboxylesterase
LKRKKNVECQLENTTVYYEVRGEGRPVLMLHGMPLDHRHMVMEMEPLFENRPGWKRIYLDLPGMGQTPGPDWITNQDQVLDLVMKFVDSVIPGERFSVVGLSYGGYLARGLIYCRKDMIDGLCMIVPAIIMDKPRRAAPELVILVKDEALMADLDPDFRQAVENLAVVQSRKVIEGWQATITPAINMADKTFLDRTCNPCQFSFEAELDRVAFDKPTLFITGRQDSSCGYQQALNLLENFPRATFAVLDTAGHCLPSEQVEIFRALGVEWLDRVARSAG